MSPFIDSHQNKFCVICNVPKISGCVGPLHDLLSQVALHVMFASWAFLRWWVVYLCLLDLIHDVPGYWCNDNGQGEIGPGVGLLWKYSCLHKGGSALLCLLPG